MKAKEATSERTSEPARKPAVVIPLGKSRSIPIPRSRGLLAWAKRHWIMASALACVALPTLVVALHLLLFASERYAVKVKFAVRGQETPAVDMLGILGNFGGSSGMSADSYILIDYVLGRGMIDDLKSSIDVRALYSKPSIDWLSRMSGNEKIEDVLDYWQKMVSANFEPSTRIIQIGRASCRERV